MGNQLVGIAPSQIFPVDRYLMDLPHVKFDASLGATRFLKVARAESQEGWIVVKVFAIHDPTLPLSKYKDHLEEIRKKLSSTTNCLPYQRIIVTEQAGIIMREYVKYTLYDRLSTRPFLTNIEKRWITFQILLALTQCHKVGVCHGDIKLENITVTSWNWVLLVDFASFKPVFLPVDNPADYSYFFDTSRRRVCYIAPERFLYPNTTIIDSNSSIAESVCDTEVLTPAMDIFSAGCALLELWNELHVPFEYSQLLSYCSGTYSPDQHLDKLGNPDLRSLISSMINKDPTQRKSAETYLNEYRNTLFPEYFYGFLQAYMLIFSSSPILTSDEKIKRLKNDIAGIYNCVDPDSDKRKEKQDRNNENQDSKSDNRDCEGVVLIISLVTSCVRGLQDCSSKRDSLWILLELASHASNETILDRILPYMMYFVRDNSSRVKIAALETITKCLELIDTVPRSEENIFPEYILPELAPLATDPDYSVRAAYAQHISTLAELSIRYLDQIEKNWYENNIDNQRDEYTFNYELELHALHSMVSNTVAALLTDTESTVKRTLMEYSIIKLCVFFGNTKACDLILSHMITFLNDKEDKEVREDFFDTIVGLVSYIGWHCATILIPLLLQGLTDSSEFVIAKSIDAMSSITELGLIAKPALCELITECSYLLVHPNLWIRHALVGFISSAANVMSTLDVQAKMLPKLRPYMKYELCELQDYVQFMDSLVTPIPRNVYDSVICHEEIDAILDVMKERMSVRNYVNTGRVPNTGLHRDSQTSLKSLFRRLEANGMNESMENYFLKMGHLLKKTNKSRRALDSKQNKQSEGKLELSPLSCNVKSLIIYLDEPQKVDFMPHSSEVLTRHSESTNSGGPPSRSTSSRPSSPHPEGNNQYNSTEPSSNASLHERSFIHYRKSNCYKELTILKKRQQDLYYEVLRNKEWVEQATWRPQLPPPGWRLGGTLVGHLHDHKGPVIKLCALPDTPLFSSSSSDGTVRLWDCSKIEGKNIANRARQHYKLADGVRITGTTVCDGGQSLGVTYHNSAISILRVDSSSNKMRLLQSWQVDDLDGYAVDVQCMESGSQSIIVYSTLYGDLIGWDLRSNGRAFKLENELKRSVLTTFCLDSQQNWLVLGTNTGNHIAWDLRFQLPIMNFDHPSGNVKIRKVLAHPTKNSWVLSSVHGNNEISMWNIETGYREQTLWGSVSPPLVKQGTSNTVCALHGGTIDRSSYLLSGGTDQRLRYWNLDNPSESYLAIPAATDPPGITLAYTSRVIDGSLVTYEENGPVRTDNGEEAPRSGPELPITGHRDCISDIIMCKASKCFLVTSSNDGVIKVWK
ncbi:vacuolar protein sorting 15 isoform X2 [Leptinotarsa decemlineata]|uniref:vacuolar protein sorting 15 isoform X2 n=1 Tax=Leptinotarsa decemlineata TaxID=7539 RepID=UPI003D30AD47